MKPVKQFLKDYRVPLEATIVFIIIILFMLFTRTVDRLALADVLGSKTDSDYATLLSKDRDDEFKKNDVSTADETEVATTPSPTTSTPFTVNPNTVSVDPPVDTGGEPEPVPPFSAQIDGPLVLEGTNIECSGTSGNNLECYKRYIFRAKIFAQNGPGMIAYSWQGSVQEANEEGSFDVGSGESYTPLHKIVVLPCQLPMAFEIELKLTQPTASQSNIVTNYHSCDTTLPPPMFP